MEKQKKGISAIQLTMLALGTVIGGSFFMGSSVAINAAGPSIVIAYVFGGVLVYYILYAMSEMTVANPSYGCFRAFAAQAFGERTGFLVGWTYWTGMVLGMSSEATAASILLRQWLPDVPLALLGSVIIAAVTLVNLIGAEKLSKIESGTGRDKNSSRHLVYNIGGFAGNGLVCGAARHRHRRGDPRAVFRRRGGRPARQYAYRDVLVLRI